MQIWHLRWAMYVGMELMKCAGLFSMGLAIKQNRYCLVNTKIEWPIWVIPNWYIWLRMWMSDAIFFVSLSIWNLFKILHVKFISCASPLTCLSKFMKLAESKIDKNNISRVNPSCKHGKHSPSFWYYYIVWKLGSR